MILTVKSNGMVLKDSPEIKLNKFTVLTGENGSGKTQLLEWISQNHYPLMNESEILEAKIKKDSDIFFYNVVFTMPGINQTPLNNQNSINTLENILTEWRSLSGVFRVFKLIPDLMKQYEEDINIHQNLTQKINSELGGLFFDLDQSLRQGQGNFDNQYIIPEYKIAQVLQCSKKAGKNPEDFTLNDFIIFREISLGGTPFFPNIDLLFHQFELKKKDYPELVKGIKPPLDIFNEILKSANFLYHAEFNFSNSASELSRVILIDNEKNIPVSFDRLSSGENTIMALIFTLYSSMAGGTFPDLILFDEPDAHLHPSMTKMFLDVVQDVLVEKNGVEVIMTTHSPSTVAIAPEDSIYYMKRSVGYPEKMDKGTAINSLIYGISGLFVSHENRRQVFVESDYDVEYYEGLYLLLKDMLSKDIQINFISSGISKIDKNSNRIATCDRVKDITKTFRKYENKHVFGIIDWDLENSCSEAITILGEGERYSIENYLLEPLLIGLMLERESHYSFAEMGIKGKTYTDIKAFTQEDFQKISDFIIEKINDLSENVPDVCKDEMVGYTLINGLTLQIPKWFVFHKGHLLEEKMIEKLPKLGDVKRGKEKGLKLAIINKLLKDTPTIISSDFLTMFQFLHA